MADLPWPGSMGTTVINLKAVVFDMDGTLIQSDYDWPAIRSELGVEGPSIIDALNALPNGQRAEAWERLESIERRASQQAHVVDGAEDLLRLLSKSAVKTALVTNNTNENTESLIDRYGLSFDEVITRDSGLYKPSAAPMVEAMRRLGVHSAETVVVGDSDYDVRAGREAKCSLVFVVNGGCLQWGEYADQAFEDLRTLTAYFESILLKEL